MIRSVLLALTVTVLCVVIGVGMAWLVARSDLPGRRVLGVVLALPIALPSYLSAFAWVSWRPGLVGFDGAVLVLTSVSYPFVFLPCAAALSQLDPGQEDVARSLGWGPWRVAFGLTFRQLRPTIAAGGLLVALYVLSDFGAVAAMRYEVFTWTIYGAYRAGFNPARAAILASVLVVIAAALVVVETRVRGVAAARVGAGTARRAEPRALRRLTLPVWALAAALIGVVLVFPITRIVSWVVSYESTDVELADVLGALGNTVRYAVLAAIVTTLAALPIGYLAARHRTRSTVAIEGATYVTHALPGIVLAIATVYLAVNLGFLRPYYQRTPVLLLGYLFVFLPLAVGSVRGAVELSPLRAEEVARALGSPPWRVTLRITAPLAARGLAAGAALVLLSTMKELPMTLVLRPTGTETLATRLWNHSTISDYGNAGPYALALVLFAAVPTAALSMAAGRLQGAAS